MYRRGFTAIELLTVIGVIVFLTVLSVPAYSTIKNNVTLGNAAQELLNTLRVAQNDAMNSRGKVDSSGVISEANHGVYIEATQYTRYDGTDWNDPNIVKSPPSNIDVPLEVSTGLPADVTFLRLQGTTTSRHICVGSAGKGKRILLDAGGRISLDNYDGPPC